MMCYYGSFGGPQTDHCNVSSVTVTLVKTAADTVLFPVPRRFGHNSSGRHPRRGILLINFASSPEGREAGEVLGGRNAGVAGPRRKSSMATIDLSRSVKRARGREGGREAGSSAASRAAY